MNDTTKLVDDAALDCYLWPRLLYMPGHQHLLFNSLKIAWIAGIKSINLSAPAQPRPGITVPSKGNRANICQKFHFHQIGRFSLLEWESASMIMKYPNKIMSIITRTVHSDGLLFLKSLIESNMIITIAKSEIVKKTISWAFMSGFVNGEYHAFCSLMNRRLNLREYHNCRWPYRLCDVLWTRFK